MKIKTFLRSTHYKMERFGVSFLAFLLVFACLFAYGFYAKNRSDQIEISDKTLYGETELTWSLTSRKTTVESVCRNSDSTQAFIVLHMDNTENISTAASDYRVFMGGTNGKIQHQVTGSFYVFGNTGYMGIRLNDPQGFEQLLSTIIVRNSGIVASEASEGYSEFDETQDSFKNFNQIQFDLNLTGKDAVVVDCLSDSKATVSDIYAQCVMPTAYDEIKTLLKSDVDEMNKCISQIYEQKRRLEQWGFTNVDLPVCVQSDFITKDADDTENNPFEFNERMLVSSGSSVISSDYTVQGNNDKNDVTKYRYIIGDNVYLSTGFVFPGGIQYNYQGMNVGDNHIDNIVPNNIRYTDWKNQKQTEAKEYLQTKWEEVDNVLLLNGAEYKENVVASDDTDKEYKDALQAYRSGINKLIKIKEQYQTEDLFKLLDIEANIKDADSFTDINSSDEVLYLLGRS